MIILLWLKSYYLKFRVRSKLNNEAFPFGQILFNTRALEWLHFQFGRNTLFLSKK
jgi:hypothetical protein